jgi:hypothetical protein
VPAGTIFRIHDLDKSDDISIYMLLLTRESQGKILKVEKSWVAGAEFPLSTHFDDRACIENIAKSLVS